MKDRIVLTQDERETADALARELALDTDRNELGKVLSYFRRTQSKVKLFQLLDYLPESGYVRSRRTRKYLQRIARVCRERLADIHDDRRMLAVLEWGFRLMTRYQVDLGTRSSRSRQKRTR